MRDPLSSHPLHPTWGADPGRIITVGSSGNRFVWPLCLSDGEPCPPPWPIGGNPWKFFARTPPQPIYETNGGGDYWQKFGSLGNIFCVPAWGADVGLSCMSTGFFSSIYFIVVVNRFLQSFCFLIKLICLLIMPLALFYLLFWFYLSGLTTE